MLSTARRIARRLAASPGFTAVAVLTLGLGIGANTAIFSVVDGVLLDALPFEESEDLLFLVRDGSDAEADLSLPDGRDLRAQATLLEELALFLPFTAFDVTGDREPERVTAAAVEPEYFRVLGMPPLHGRALAPEDDAVGAERVVILSELFWRARLGGDPDAVGGTIRLTGEPYTIVGVMPAEFDFLQAGIDAWVPIAPTVPWVVEERGTNNLEGIARLAPGASLEAASAELRTISGRLADAYPDTNQGKVVRAIPLRDRLVGATRPVLWILLGAVAVVLLIACVNVASLLLVRATTRERDVAVRMAMGGGKLRVAAGAFGEALALALIGGAVGTLLAVWGTQALISLAPEGLPRLDAIDIDRTVLGFTFSVCLLTALLFGLIPALHAMRRDPADLLARTGGRGAAGRSQRFLSIFVIAEVALAAILLVGSGLLLRSFLSLQRVDLGFEPEGVITANFVLPEDRYGERAAQDRAFEAIVQALDGAPGVEHGAFLLGAPLADYGAIGSSIAFDDRPPPAPGERPSARLRLVLGDYFTTMRQPILSGRPFASTDGADSEPVAIVNEAFAEAFWPGETPLGKRVATLMAGEPDWMTVVGVAGDVAQNTVAAGDEVTLYVPYAQREMAWARFGTLVARGPGDAEALSETVEQALWTVDPTVPLDRIAPLEDLVDASLAPARFTTLLVGLFAVLALVIAVQGLYGVLAYAVAQRRGEIGVRMALGARSVDVLELVIKRGVTLAGLGLFVGLATSLVAMRLLRALLYEVGTSDALTYAGVGLLLAATAVAASALPALKAARLDPARTLREE